MQWYQIVLIVLGSLALIFVVLDLIFCLFGIGWRKKTGGESDLN